MTRLGSKLPFDQAVEEVWYGYQTQVAESTLRRITYANGAAAEALLQQEVAVIEKEAPESPAAPAQVLLSVDGAFVALTSGEWREVKTLAVGEFETVTNPDTWQREVHTHHLSTFSRSYGSEAFERFALAELHRRGLEKAQTVVAVNDGAAWIQGFLDYHCPSRAVRIIDFAHAAAYVAQAGKAIWEEESEAFKRWYGSARHRLRYEPPQQTIANLRLLQPRAKTAEQAALVEGALFYLQSRVQMLDYPHFVRRGYPIGSGSVESSHKRVVQSRLKGAGMRWAPQHLDPLLSLRNLVCNGRWDEGWQQIVLFRQEQAVRQRLRRAQAKQPPPSAPITFAALEAAGLLPEDHGPATTATTPPDTFKRTRDGHPWNNNKWPTREAWRWN